MKISALMFLFVLVRGGSRELCEVMSMIGTNQLNDNELFLTTLCFVKSCSMTFAHCMDHWDESRLESRIHTHLLHPRGIWQFFRRSVVDNWTHFLLQENCYDHRPYNPLMLVNMTKVISCIEFMMLAWTKIFVLNDELMKMALDMEGRATDLAVYELRDIFKGMDVKLDEFERYRCVSCSVAMHRRDLQGIMINTWFYFVCSEKCKKRLEHCYCYSCGAFPERTEDGVCIGKKTKYEEKSGMRFCGRACQRTYRKTANITDMGCMDTN